MKILIVIPNNSRGGAEQFLRMIASNYKSEEVSVYMFKKLNLPFKEVLETDFEVHYLSSNSELIGIFKFMLTMLFKKTNFDYTYTSHVKTNAIVGFLRTLHVIKSKYVVARESTSIFLRFKGKKLAFYKLLYAIGYNKIDLLICQTDLMKQQFEKYNPRISSKTKIKVIPNPIRLPNKENRLLNNKPLLNNDPFMVAAGRLIPIKGFDILINAFAQIKKETPNLKLVLLGDGLEKQNLKQLAQQLNIEKDVIFAGFIENIYDYFSQAKLCVVSSLMEGFPNVLLQMMSQNNKIVSTLCAGGIETIPGIFTCNPNNIEALTTALSKCLKKDTSTNTEVFKQFISNRTVDAFITTLNKELNAI